MCLAQWHRAVPQVRLKPAAPRSRIKHSTTEPLCSFSTQMKMKFQPLIKTQMQENKDFSCFKKIPEYKELIWYGPISALCAFLFFKILYHFLKQCRPISADFWKLGAQLLSDRVLDLRPRGPRLEPHRHHCVVSFSKTHLSLLCTGSTQEDPSQHNWKIVDRDVKNQIKQTNKQSFWKLKKISFTQDLSFVERTT